MISFINIGTFIIPLKTPKYPPKEGFSSQRQLEVFIENWKEITFLIVAVAANDLSLFSVFHSSILIILACKFAKRSKSWNTYSPQLYCFF